MEFIEVIDIFIKAHKILNIDYLPTHKKVMEFLEVCVFNIEKENLSAKDQAFFAKILNEITELEI